MGDNTRIVKLESSIYGSFGITKMKTIDITIANCCVVTVHESVHKNDIIGMIIEYLIQKHITDENAEKNVNLRVTVNEL